MIEKAFYTCILFDVILLAMLAIMLTIYGFVLNICDDENKNSIEKIFEHGINIIGLIFLICLSATLCFGFTLFANHFLTKIWSS